jgi:phage repressor protein C with HTH and peptisase S24 domain
MTSGPPPTNAAAGKDTDRQAGLDAPRRAVLAALTQARLTLKQGSRALARNDAYLQQYLYRGSPRRLPEEVRLRLAELTGERPNSFLDPQLRQLHGTSEPLRLVVPLLDVSAAAGGGRFGGDSSGEGASGDETALAFPPMLLRRITSAPTSSLRLITVSGDSMAPTLEDGDMVMIDIGRTSPSPPGIFVLDDGVGLVAKRVDAVPNSFPQQLRLSSDNPAYSNYQRRIDEVRILGRVVWFARSL